MVKHSLALGAAAAHRCVEPSPTYLPDASPRARSRGEKKMSRLGRTRRTRVYNCNYNKGESYYRPVLDRLDGKLETSKVGESHRQRIQADVENRNLFRGLEEEHNQQSDLFNSKSKLQYNRHVAAVADEDEFSDEITESLKRLRAGKNTSRFAEDIDFENSAANIENRMRISDKILESVGIGSSETSSSRRALQENEERTEKRIARRLNEDNSLTKWSALKSGTEESAAMQRAKASQARLNDLEDEMSELNERSMARDKRAARLRALVADSNSSDTTTSKITIRSEREKKQVTF